MPVEPDGATDGNPRDRLDAALVERADADREAAARLLRDGVDPNLLARLIRRGVSLAYLAGPPQGAPVDPGDPPPNERSPLLFNLLAVLAEGSEPTHRLGMAAGSLADAEISETTAAAWDKAGMFPPWQGRWPSSRELAAWGPLGSRAPLWWAAGYSPDEAMRLASLPESHPDRPDEYTLFLASADIDPEWPAGAGGPIICDLAPE